MTWGVKLEARFGLSGPIYLLGLGPVFEAELGLIFFSLLLLPKSVLCFSQEKTKQEEKDVLVCVLLQSMRSSSFCSHLCDWNCKYLQEEGKR